jgi:ABC-type bacteriocin/lantibiotic exporter with double-glycine peptidase domain
VIPESASRAQRRWLVPEVVQTSAMDCGPASLKCVLEGFRIPVSYGRLREACQTDIDGTSIDAIETIANQLGVAAEQVMIPADHLFLTQAAALPAVVVVKHSDGATHFVVVWRRHGSWLQVMDPAIGRRWVRIDRFTEEVFRHETSVSADGWRDWAASDDFLGPLRQRLAEVGTSATGAASLIDRALEESNWFGLGSLDASVRFVASLIEAGGLSAGAQSSNLMNALFEQTYGSTDDIHRIIPRVYWSVVPDKRDAEGALHLTLRGVVLVRLQGRRASGIAAEHAEQTPPLSTELAAALAEKPVNALTTISTLLRADGILGPAALIGAMGLAAGAVLLEILLFRGLFDISWALNLPSQRLAAVAALLAFGALLLLVEIPIVMESMRFGRHLETRLRMALLRKLPQLTDRYFHSRPVSDMADRSHSIHLSRLVPGLGLHFVQAMCDLTFTLVGIVIIDPQSVGLALAIATAAMVLPLAIQPLVNERDLRVRNHAGALSGFYLDALLALVPIRAHGAAQAVRRQHEGLLVEWARSTRGLIRLSMSADAVQSLVCLGLAGLLLLQHFLRSGGATGGDLLLVYWTLKLPAIGQGISQLAQQYPAQRNVLLRLLEPLSAPTEIAAGGSQTQSPLESPRELPARAEPRAAASVSIENGSVLAGGHALLRVIDLAIAPGEHVAIVGASGAGKSTLVGLMLGWHRLAEGTLLLDGERSTPSGLERLRREIAWVDPAIQIWNRPFLENLNYAVDADNLERTGSAIDAADLRRLLQKLPDGLQTWLGEGGALLSGGEGQRVRLARALMQSGVRLALLDEPFRGMDRGQRTRLLAEARVWWKDATLLCVTHDVGETLAFDRVLVVEAGRIIEDGAPSQLKASKSRYRELLDAENTVRSQMWQGTQWRRLRVDNGLIQAGGPRALASSRPQPQVRAAK